MQQVVVIHGGTTFSSYESYLDNLRTKSVKIERLLAFSSWKETLQQRLGESYQVLLPTMPNATNAQYGEWKIWFERIAEVCENDCILIGHSLGGVFLVKYLSENQFPQKIKATILVAAPYDDESTEDMTDFKITGVTDRFVQQAGKVVFFNGEDDPVVSVKELEKYKVSLPSAKFIVMPAPDHFVRTDFPELIETLRRIR